MQKIDFQRINDAALCNLESYLHEWLPGGRREGHEYKCGDLTGSPGRSLSVNINTGVWRDFAGDAGGSDPISLLAAIRNCGQGDAAKELASRLSLGVVDERPAPKPKPAADEWVAEPQSPDITLGPVSHPKFGMPSRFWQYPGHGLICRFDTPQGKDITPLAWCRNTRTGDVALRWKSFRKPRPLYFANGDAEGRGVVIVEGEKAADAAARLLPQATVVTWPGGSKAVRFTDWTPLAGRKIIIWPDNDEPGAKAAVAIVEMLPQAFIVTPPPGTAEGWDLADAEEEGWTTARVGQWIKECRAGVQAPPPPEPIPEHYEPEPVEPEGYEPEPIREPDPFRSLGYDDGEHYYLPEGSKQIVRISTASHTKMNLLALAPLNYWEANFPSKNGVNWDHAANAILRRSERTGVFDPSRIRGRGAWLDNGRVVFHAGDRLFVNGDECAISAFDSSEIYPRSHRMQVDISEQARNAEAAKLLDLVAQMNWKHALDSKLMAGWLAVAPICGVLEWRPHIWLNGPSGSGKTWFLTNVVRPLLGKSALYVQSNTSEAGIRQSLGCDAIPVVFDEAETENARDQQRIQSVLILARQASRDTDARIVKGSATGQAMAYFIRSSFLFSSIATGASQRSDMSRITALELTKIDDSQKAHEQFDKLIEVWKETTAQPEWCARLRTRSLMLAEVIAANAATFARAATPFLGQQRDGDQIGALLAGAFSLTSTRAVTFEQASEWCAQQDWSVFQPAVSDADESMALSQLLAWAVTYEDGEGRRRDSTFGELIERALMGNKQAKDSLIRHGVNVDAYDRVTIANSHPSLKKCFADTPYAAKWAQQFARLDGAEKLDGARFLGATMRAVRLPKTHFID